MRTIMKLHRNISLFTAITISLLLIVSCSTEESKQEAQKLLDRQVKVIKEKEIADKTIEKEKPLGDSLKKEQKEPNHDKKQIEDQSVKKIESVPSDINKPKKFNTQDTIIKNNIRKESGKEVKIEHKDSITAQKSDTTIGNSDEEEIQKESDLIEIKKLPVIQDSVQKTEMKLKPVKEIENEDVKKNNTADEVKKEVVGEAKKVVELQEEIEVKQEKSVSVLTKTITVLVVIGLISFIILYMLGKRDRSKTRIS
ncbi:MAG: hypothetical protein C0597_12590 [Marinilabiliales bacterium]|nr:MAG: hypothetical protein C0597_12590 [Marinilabiliales bacterium]